MREVVRIDGKTRITYRPYKNDQEKRDRKEQLKSSKSNLQRTIRRATESNSRQLQEIKAAIEGLKPVEKVAPRRQEEERTTRTVHFVESRHPTVRFNYKSVPMKEDYRKFESRNSDLYIPESSKDNRRKTSSK
jgi:hypothetical protein